MMRNLLAATAAVLALSIAPGAAAFKLDLNKLGDIVQSVARSGDALAEVSEERERELGAGIAARLLGAVPLVDDPELQRYVNRVGLWVALQSGRPNLAWRFGVLNTESVNAFAVPGGYVFVTSGLLRTVTNEAELAGVLAHEIVHVVQRHHLMAIQSKARSALATEVLASLADQRGALSDALIGVGMEVYGKGLDRDDELDADRRGVLLSARSGYNAYGLPAVLHALASMNPADGSLALMMSTHPSASRRLEALAPVLDSRFDEPENLRTLEDRFLAMQRRLN